MRQPMSILLAAFLIATAAPAAAQVDNPACPSGTKLFGYGDTYGCVKPGTSEFVVSCYRKKTCPSGWKGAGLPDENSMELCCPPASKAKCQSWQLPSKFNAIEPDQFFVVFDMKKDKATAEGKDDYKGTAYYNTESDFREVAGFAHALVKGQEFDISFFPGWTPTNSFPGTEWRYKGLITESGDLLGTAERDRKRTSWKSRQKAICLERY